ncbi:hypothetical protein [Spongiimicrobium salis]|uniref:hypothetical protein n=1 Tax=Spongiimicrobium salis TaxID=1667022 RepID=UPI00374D05F1
MKKLSMMYASALLIGAALVSCENDFEINDANVDINNPVINIDNDGNGVPDNDEPAGEMTPEQEATLITSLGASEAGRTLEDFNGSNRGFDAELNVFLPSAIAVADLRDNRQANTTLPIYEGIGPNGQPTYFIITESSTPETAEIYGAILSPKLRYGALPGAADAAMRVTVNANGRIVLPGDVDFSPVRSITPGEAPNFFPPAAVQPGAVGDNQYSSLVVLPSGTVINLQVIANATGTHDRIREINIDQRWVNFELLDGWQGGDNYYYHLVTDSSDPGPATIELGVYAPRMANLPVFGQSELDGETVLLGFSPNTNGITLTEGGSEVNRQGLGSSVVDPGFPDPINIFPFDPDNSDPNNNYSPMWDAHLNQWTDAAIDAGLRRPITSFEDLSALIDAGSIESFFGSPGIENDFVFGLRATNAVINCPVICQPFEGQ